MGPDWEMHDKQALVCFCFVFVWEIHFQARPMMGFSWEFFAWPFIGDFNVVLCELLHRAAQCLCFVSLPVIASNSSKCAVLPLAGNTNVSENFCILKSIYIFV